jgi:hypothetical protein
VTRPLAFKQSDVTRALKGAKAAGVEVILTLALDGRTLTMTPASAAPQSPLDAWKRSRDAR